MFASFFKNLHQSTLTITNMTCKCLIRPRCVASVCGLKHTLKFVGKYSYFNDSDLIAAYFFCLSRSLKKFISIWSFYKY